MESVWVDSVARALEQALDSLGAAVRDCPQELWHRGMWQVSALPAEHTFLNPDWTPVTGAEEREALADRWVQRRSAPWSVAWHALEVLDYDLNGEFAPWMPPEPFAGHPHWRDVTMIETPWTAAQILGYLEHCRDSMRTLLGNMTDEMAARTLPPTHRYGSQPHAVVIVGLVAHTAEHAAQIRQFAANLAGPPTEVARADDSAPRAN